MRAAAEQLEGAIIERIVRDDSSGGLKIVLSNDLHVEIDLSSDAEMEDWMLFLSDGLVVSSVGGALSVEAAAGSGSVGK